MRRISKSIVILGVAVCFTGCMRILEADFKAAMSVKYPRSDVTSEVAMWGGYEPQGTYELLVDSILQPRFLLGHVCVISPLAGEKRFHGYDDNAPSSESDYELNRDKWPEAKGFVRKGTLVNVTQAVLQRGPQMGGGLVHVKGKIVDGPFKGEWVFLSDCSNIQECRVGVNVTYLPIPDDSVLRKVDNS